jgi:5-methylcytosine-specific restriction endonuclease McrA
MLLQLVCKNCKNEFQRHHYFVWSEDVFCSVKCHRQYIKKSSHHLKNKREETKKYILERDHHSCVICGKRGVRLNIHHIDGSGDTNCWEKSNNNFENLVTLCTSCHTCYHWAERKN